MAIGFSRQYARTRRFTLGAPRGFQVCPDGSRVLFLRSRDGTDPVTCLWALDLGPSDTGGPDGTDTQSEPTRNRTLGHRQLQVVTCITHARTRIRGFPRVRRRGDTPWSATTSATRRSLRALRRGGVTTYPRVALGRQTEREDFLMILCHAGPHEATARPRPSKVFMHRR